MARTGVLAHGLRVSLLAYAGESVSFARVGTALSCLSVISTDTLSDGRPEPNALRHFAVAETPGGAAVAVAEELERVEPQRLLAHILVREYLS